MGIYSIICVAMAAIPALVLVWVFYRWDAHKPEPKGLIIWVFVWGVLSTIPAVLLEVGIGWVGGIFTRSVLFACLFRAFVVAGLCEEFIKLKVVKYFAYHKDAFDEVMDGVVYTVVASLGFACLENVMYVLPGGPLTALVRAFTAIPLHAFASGLMGYYIGRAKFAATPRQERALIRTGLIVAVVIHGTYDFLLFASGSGLIGRWWSLGIVPLLIGTLVALRSRVRLAMADDLHNGRA